MSDQMNHFANDFANSLDIAMLKSEVKNLSSKVFELIERFDALEARFVPIEIITLEEWEEQNEVLPTALEQTE